MNDLRKEVATLFVRYCVQSDAEVYDVVESLALAVIRRAEQLPIEDDAAHERVNYAALCVCANTLRRHAHSD